VALALAVSMEQRRGGLRDARLRIVGRLRGVLDAGDGRQNRSDDYRLRDLSLPGPLVTKVGLLVLGGFYGPQR